MGFFNFFRNDGDGQLFGCWHLVRVDGPSHSPDEVELDFRKGGRLLYSFKTGYTWKVHRLDYRVEGQVIITSDDVRRGYEIEANGALRLDAPDSCVWYERGPKKAPERKKFG